MNENPDNAIGILVVSDQSFENEVDQNTCTVVQCNVYMELSYKDA
jgi:hypothetical protein